MLRQLFIGLVAVSALSACGVQTKDSSVNAVTGDDGAFHGFNGALTIKQDFNLDLDATAKRELCFSKTSDGFALHPCTELEVQTAGTPSISAGQAVLFDRIISKKANDITPADWDRTVHERLVLKVRKRPVGSMIVSYSTRVVSTYPYRTVSTITGMELETLCSVDFENYCTLDLTDGKISLDPKPTLEPLKAQF